MHKLIFETNLFDEIKSFENKLLLRGMFVNIQCRFKGQIRRSNF